VLPVDQQRRPAYPNSRRQHAVLHAVQPWFSNPAAPPRLEGCTIGNATPGDPSISVTTARDKLQLKKPYRRVKVSSARARITVSAHPLLPAWASARPSRSPPTPSQGQSLGSRQQVGVGGGDGSCQTRSSKSPIHLHAGRVKLAPSTKCFGELKISKELVGPDTAKEKLPSSTRYKRGRQGGVLFLLHMPPSTFLR
jgi:hypothetical protein